MKIIIYLSIILIMSCEYGSTIEETNINMVKKYYKTVNSKDTALVANLVSESFTKTNNNKEAEIKGPRLLSESIKTHIRNNKEYKFIIDDIFSTRNKVTVRWRWESINIKFGEEKKVKSQGISIFEIKNGKIDNLKQAFDILGFNKQLGIK
jgi:limonene-1,2-epoxide hydrolase